MSALKTTATPVNVADFLETVEPPNRRADGIVLCAFMARVTGEPPVMWGPSIIGFGKYRYTYASGHSGESCRVGFSPRKAKLVLYVTGSVEVESELIAKLGKVKTGKGCIYVTRLVDIDLAVLEELIHRANATLNERYPG